MSRRLSVAAILFMLGLTGARAQTDNAYVLAGLTAYDGTKTFDVVTPGAFTELVREAKLDNEALPKAYANLANAWREAHAKSTKSVPFPLKSPTPREVRQLGTFATTEAAAQEKRAREEQEAARLKRQADDEARRKPQELTNTGLKRPPQRAPTNQAQPPDPDLVKSTYTALADEIRTVRVDISLGNKGNAPKPPPKSHRK